MTGPGASARAAFDEGMFVDIHGAPQWVTLRGADAANPAILILHGPGFAHSPMAPLFAPWKADFTVVQWDQPGAGATCARAGGPRAVPLSLSRMVYDGLAVVETVLRRLQRDKLILCGISGGSILGLMMIQRRPDLFSAYVGNGQIVHWARQEALSYAMILDQARTRGDAQAIAELERIGPPPWPDIASIALKAKYANAMTPAEQAAFTSLLPLLAAPPPEARYLARGLPAYDPMVLATTAFEQLMPEITAFDAWALGPRFDVPVVFLQGAHDAHTPSPEVRRYADEIQAPAKAFAVIEDGGHASIFLTEELLTLLNRHVRPLAAAPLN